MNYKQMKCGLIVNKVFNKIGISVFSSAYTGFDLSLNIKKQWMNEHDALDV